MAAYARALAACYQHIAAQCHTSTSQERSLMLTIPEVYDLFDRSGWAAASPPRWARRRRFPHRALSPATRRVTCAPWTKPFYRQLVEGGNIRLRRENRRALQLMTTTCRISSQASWCALGMCARSAARGGDCRRQRQTWQFNVAIRHQYSRDPRVVLHSPGASCTTTT